MCHVLTNDAYASDARLVPRSLIVTSDYIYLCVENYGAANPTFEKVEMYIDRKEKAVVVLDSGNPNGNVRAEPPRRRRSRRRSRRRGRRRGCGRRRRRRGRCRRRRRRRRVVVAVAVVVVVAFAALILVVVVVVVDSQCRGG